MTKSKKMNRRKFLGSAAAGSLGLTVVPRNVLGGPGFVAPNDKLTVGYIGCGTQGLREMVSLIANPALQIVAVSDPNKFSTDYIDWSLNGIRNGIRRALGDSGWGENFKGIPGGRDIGQEFVQKYYAGSRDMASYKGCSSYEDYRELLEKEKDIDVIKIMTPDHLHAHVAIHSMNKGSHVVTHKPIANRMKEFRATYDTAKRTGLRTHLLAWSPKPGYELAKKWIGEGLIGTLREIHNWSNRPVWPQWQTNPAETVPLPEGFNWDLWLGPVPDRPYHPNYTHNVFRGWYDFGGGSIADMGHYSLFPLFLTFGIDKPALSADAFGTTTAVAENHVCRGVVNNVAFPLSCMIRFEMPATRELGAFDLYWWDGGMRPFTPEELLSDGKSFDREGMMFVGDRGKILAGFRGENPRLIPESRMAGISDKEPEITEPDTNEAWIQAFRSNTEARGSFLLAGPVTETILLGTVSLRAGKRVEYDSKNMSITNVPEANKFLTREYRPGWEL